MIEPSKTRQIGLNALAFVLWLGTVALALEAIYIVKELFYLIYVLAGRQRRSG